MKQPQPRVLIVNRDPEVLRVISNILEREGFNITSANSTADALTNVATGNFDVVIVDNLSGNNDEVEIVRQGRLRAPTLKVLYLYDHYARHDGDPDLDSCVVAPIRVREIVGCTWELYYRGTRRGAVAVPRLDLELERLIARPAPADDVAVPVLFSNVITAKFPVEMVSGHRKSITKPLLLRVAGRSTGSARAAGCSGPDRSVSARGGKPMLPIPM